MRKALSRCSLTSEEEANKEEEVLRRKQAMPLGVENMIKKVFQYKLFLGCLSTDQDYTKHLYSLAKQLPPTPPPPPPLSHS